MGDRQHHRHLRRTGLDGSGLPRLQRLTKISTRRHSHGEAWGSWQIEHRCAVHPHGGTVDGDDAISHHRDDESHRHRHRTLIGDVDDHQLALRLLHGRQGGDHVAARDPYCDARYGCVGDQGLTNRDLFGRNMPPVVGTDPPRHVHPTGKMQHPTGTHPYAR